MAAGGMNSAEAMDNIYRRQRWIYDITRNYYLLGRDQMLADLAPLSGQTVLEIGCGTGRNLVSAARLYPQAQFHGFDVSREMLESAAASVRRAGLESCIKLAQADATSFTAASLSAAEGFDRVFISYTLSMIPDWRAVLEHAALALNENGSLHIVDFSQQRKLPQFFKNILFAWLARFSVHPDEALEQELNDLAQRHGLSLSVTHPWRGYAISAVLRRN